MHLKRALRRLLPAGEGKVAGVGLAAVGVVLVMTASIAWWSVSEHRRSATDARREEIRGVADMLARASAPLLAAGEVSAARTLLAQAVLDHQLTVGRITLATGQVIADVEPGKVSAEKLPESWGSALKTPTPNIAPNVATELTPIVVPGRGAAMLEIAGSIEPPWATSWELKAGVAGIGVVGLGLLWLLYRRLRSRLQAVAAIGDALSALARGERSAQSLTINPALGPEARQWNTLLDEMEALRTRAADRHAAESLTVSAGGGAELTAACDAMWQGLIIADEDLKIRYSNGAAAAYLGVKREQLRGAA